MSAIAPGGPRGTDEPRRLTALFGALAGGISVVLPYFDGLVAALGALLVAAHVLHARARPGSVDILPVRAYASWLALAAGWVVFLLAPHALDAVRGLALGLSGLPVGLWTRSERDPGSVTA